MYYLRIKTIGGRFLDLAIMPLTNPHKTKLMVESYEAYDSKGQSIIAPACDCFATQEAAASEARIRLSKIMDSNKGEADTLGLALLSLDRLQRPEVNPDEAPAGLIAVKSLGSVSDCYSCVLVCGTSACYAAKCAQQNRADRCNVYFKRRS